MKEQIREKKETDLLLRRTELSTLLHEEELRYQVRFFELFLAEWIRF